MSIVRVSSLSSADLSLLGNNLNADERRGGASRRKRMNRRLILAVNRSLARVGERVARLRRPLLTMP